MGDLGSIPGLGRSPGGGHGNPLQYPCLENPQGQRSLGRYSPRSRRVGHDWATFTHTPSIHAWEIPRLSDFHTHTHTTYFCLGNPTDRGATVQGVARIWHNLTTINTKTRKNVLSIIHIKKTLSSYLERGTEGKKNTTPALKLKITGKRIEFINLN